jgi:hypothetical protein
MKMRLAFVLALLRSSSRAETIGHAELAVAQPWVVLIGYVTQLSFNGGVLVIPVHDKVCEVPPELVAWGEALHGAVRKSASSLGGRLELPPIEFSS